MSKYLTIGVPIVAQQVNPVSIHEGAGLIPGPAQWVKEAVVAMSCGIGHRCGLDLGVAAAVLRWAAAALIQPSAVELLYATGADLEKKKSYYQD